MLRYYEAMESLKGKVVSGDGRGGKIGFPTLNLPYEGELEGVYVAEVSFDGRKYGAAVNLGKRPTFDSDLKFCELHILDFDDSMTEGSELEVNFIERIREVKKFTSIEELVKQIKDDVAFAKNCYTEHRNNKI